MKAVTFTKNDFYVPILRALEAIGGSGSVEEIDDRVVEITGLTAADLEVTYEKSGALMVPDKISWGRSRLGMAGLLKKEGRGLWVVTELGRETLAKGGAAVHAVVAEAERAYYKEYNAAKAAKKGTGANVAAMEIADTAHIEAEVIDGSADGGDWADLLLARVKTIHPSEFERLCQRLLRRNGFTQVEVTGKSGDGGIDGKGVVRVNLVSFHVLFQCKRYEGSVGAPTVRDFRGAMQGRADKGLIITTGTFTPDARREATRDGAPAIDLIDGAALTGLLKDHGLGVKVEQVERVTVDDAFFAEI